MRQAVVLGAAVLALACHDSAGPGMGTLAGTVVLHDSWGTALDDFSGVEVAVDGRGAGTFTDRAGAWRIDSVPAGRHDVTFTKATFGTVRLSSQTVTNGPSTTMPDVIMALTPWQQAIVDSIGLIMVTTPARTDSIYFVGGHLSAPPPDNAKAVAVVLFAGKTIAVSPDTTTFERWNTFNDGTGKSSKFFVILSVDDVRKAFGAGARAFVAAYVTAAACTCYPDKPSPSKPLFTNTGPRANVVPLSVQ